MQVLFNLPVNNQNNYQYNNYRYPSFKINPKELKGIDHFVYKRFRINPQQFKTFEKFQEHCKTLAKGIKDKDLWGRQKETQIQRKAMINDWYNYLTANGAYTGAVMLMILGGITSGLKPKEDTLPPVLNKGVLANTIDKIEKTAKENPNIESITFDKEYRLNLKNAIMSEEAQLDKNLNGWIIIPSREHDPENFGTNIEKLKMLSHNNWCTKSFNAEPYLILGDFHVYIEGGKPKLGVRFYINEIEEIQGGLNNGKIPYKYYDVIKSHIKEYKLTDDAKQELRNLEKVKAEVDELKSRLPKGIENSSAQEIFDSLGIKYRQDTDGMLIIANYGDLNGSYSYSDLGIDENKLFMAIKKITGNANFTYSEVTSLGKLEKIGGNADFTSSKITDLGNLHKIGGNAYFANTNVKSLKKLAKVGGDLHLEDSRITDLGNLQIVRGNFLLDNYSEITTLGKLRKIGGNINLSDTGVNDLGMLEYVGGNANFAGSKIKDLGKLCEIGEEADFMYTQITTLGNLEKIGGDAFLHKSQIRDLGKLKSVGGEMYYENGQFEDTYRLEEICMPEEDDDDYDF